MDEEKELKQINNNEKKLAIYSLFVPLGLAMVLCSIEIFSGFRNGLNEEVLNFLLKNINSYIGSTLLSTACFALLQQFFLFMPAGVTKEKGVLMFISSFVYGFYYVFYLSGTQAILEIVSMFLLGIVFFFIILESLRIKEKKDGVENFVGG